MGFLSDIKKLLFGAKSVTKSAADKTVTAGKDLAEDSWEKAKDAMEDTGTVIRDKTAGLRDAILEKGGDVIDKAKDTAEDIVDKVKENEFVQKTADFTEDLGDKILNVGEKTYDAVKDVSGDVGEKVEEKGSELLDKAKDVAENVGEKMKDVKEDIVEKAKDVVKDLSGKLDDTIEKAEEMERIEKAQPKSEFSDKPMDTSESLLEDKDDFFSKAERYSEGEYGAFSEGKISISKASDDAPESKAPKAKIAGFEDLDGDGNEMVDDAILVTDEEE
jgi:gas vesicle protein